jgi:predicted permease
VASLAGYVGAVPVTLDRLDGGQARRLWGQLATPDYFAVLGVQPVLGRLFGPDEQVEGATAVVLGEHLWRTRFGGSPAIVGDSVRINGHLVTVIGVAARGFAGASPMTAAADLWIPTTAPTRIAPELAARRAWQPQNVEIVGRLLPGVSLDHAERVLEATADRVEPALGHLVRVTNEPRIRLLPGGRMFPVRDQDLPRAIGFPLVLVMLVLIMACGNVANMVLARGTSREREFSIRLSLGASRGRIVRQLLAESAILSLLGSLAGGAVAVWLLTMFDRMRPLLPEYVQYEVRFHWAAFAMATIVASAATLFFSLAPSLRTSRQDIQSTLKPNASPAARGFRRFGLRNVVIYQQVVLSVVLLLLTGFIVVGWTRAANIDLGYQPGNVYFLNVDPVRDGRTPAETAQIVDRLLEQLRSRTGVAAVSLAQTVPLAMSGTEAIVSVRSDLAAGTRSLGTMRVDRVATGFFDAVGTRLLRGRDFTSDDHADRSRVLIVNETMAATTWPGIDPIGQTLTLGDATWEVIGVVADMRSAFPLAPKLPAVYQPVTPAGFASPSRTGVSVVVRATMGADAPSLLLDAVRLVDSRLTVVDIKPLTRNVEQAVFLARVATFVYGGMGVFGLILAVVGLAGVTAYAVARRTREIGIRIALGAQRADVLRLVLRESGAITAAGIVTGIGLALLLARALAGVVEALAETTRTSISDPTLLVGGPALVLTLALLACYLPARRATRIDPVIALRSE